MANNDFKATVESLFSGMDTFINTKTVVGEPINVGDDTLILPLVEVTFGVGAGAFGGEKGNNAGGGLGGKMSPNSVLVVKGDKVKLVNIKNQDGITKVLDLLPEVVDKISGKVKNKNGEKDLSKEEITEIIEDNIKESDD